MNTFQFSHSYKNYSVGFNRNLFFYLYILLQRGVIQFTQVVTTQYILNE